MFQPVSRTPTAWRWWQLIAPFLPAFVIAAGTAFVNWLDPAVTLAIGIVTTVAVLAIRAAYLAEADVQARLAAPTIKTVYRSMRLSNGKRLLRVKSLNEGPQEVPADTIWNLQVPQSWTVFRPSDENGNAIIKGEVLRGDIPLIDANGAEVPSRIWNWRNPFLWVEGEQHLHYFEVEGAPAGQHPVRLQIGQLHLFVVDEFTFDELGREAA